jgi:hypothetical protein
VLAGYGDWVANTGPIHVESVPTTSPLDAWTDQVTVETEQITVFRSLTDGRVIAPQTDPQGGGVGYAQRSVGGVWSNLNQRIATDGEHVLDMVEFAGRLWACGSDGDVDHDYAVVWHSTDGGATWVESLRDPVSVVDSRFFCLAPIGDALWVHNTQQDHTFKWTAAGGWTSSAVQMLSAGVYGGPGVPWAGGHLIPSTMPGVAAAFDLYYFDGTTTTMLAMNVVGWSVGDDGDLYVMSTNGRIDRAASGSPATFAPIVQINGAKYRSLAILPGSTEAVIGTTDSTIVRVPVA